VGPTAALVLAALLVLNLWTGLDLLVWQRVENNANTGVSIGQCSWKNVAVQVVPLSLIMLITTVLTAFMMWKKTRIDEAYAKIDPCLQTASPGVLPLRRWYWCFAMSLLLTFLPIFIAYRRVIGGIDKRNQTKRGERDGINVSGVSQPTPRIRPSPCVVVTHKSRVIRDPECAPQFTKMRAKSLPRQVTCAKTSFECLHDCLYFTVSRKCRLRCFEEPTRLVGSVIVKTGTAQL
jgi:hypothetical protein